MPRVDFVNRTAIRPSFRLRQIEGLFGLSIPTCQEQRFTAELPEHEAAWQVGAIVGHSGSGKSSLAAAAFGNCRLAPAAWSDEAALIDGFEPGPIHHITRGLAAVGLGHVTAWIRPVKSLSQGERFRADLARALLSGQPCVVIDEFASALDAVSAKLCAAAVARAVRSGRFVRQMVVVTHRRELPEWLAADWWFDCTTTRLFQAERPARRLAFEIRRARQGLWNAFAEFHYLDRRLSPFCQAFVALWQNRPAAFCGVLHAAGYRDRKRISRLVVRPEFQGLGLGTALLNAVAQHFHAAGQRVSLTTSHPALVAVLRRGRGWQLQAVDVLGKRPQRSRGITATSWGRPVARGEYTGPPDADPRLELTLRLDQPHVEHRNGPFTLGEAACG